MKRLHPLWADVYILENDFGGARRVLPRRPQRRASRAWWLVAGGRCGGRRHSGQRTHPRHMKENHMERQK